MLRILRTAFFLALKNIAARRTLPVLLTLIIGISYANLLFFSGVMNGMAYRMDSQTVENAYSNIIIEPGSGKQYIENADSMVKKIEGVPGVIAVAARYQMPGVLQYKDRAVTSPLFFSVDAERDLSALRNYVTAGEYLDKNDVGYIVIGKEVSGRYGRTMMPEDETLGAEIGNRIRVTYTNGVTREYKVKGVVDTEFWYPDHGAFITKKEAEMVLGVSNKASQVLVKVPMGSEEHYVAELKKAGIGSEIKTWRDKADFSARISQSFGMINAIITAVGLFTVAVTIFIILYINVTQRRRQIGILKAIGIDDGVIALSYLLQAVLYAVAGIIVGLLITGAAIGYVASHPLNLPMGPTTLVIYDYEKANAAVSIFAVALIGAIIPALRAARENIIKAIWG